MTNLTWGSLVMNESNKNPKRKNQIANLQIWNKKNYNSEEQKWDAKKYLYEETIANFL